MQLEEVQYTAKSHNTGAFCRLSRFLVVFFAATMSLAPTATVLAQQSAQTAGQSQGLVKARAAQKSIRIWSAACSSGQEPYSLAMILNEQKLQLAGWRFEILATDLSTEILDKAQTGMYSQFEVQRGLPIQLLVKYFKQHGDRWQIDDAIRKMVQFRPFNLLDDFTSWGPFDIVFCRNVLIYFDRDAKAHVLDGTARVLAPDGALILGAGVAGSPGCQKEL